MNARRDIGGPSIGGIASRTTPFSQRNPGGRSHKAGGCSHKGGAGQVEEAATPCRLEMVHISRTRTYASS